jgi:hypothetical protein
MLVHVYEARTDHVYLYKIRISAMDGVVMILNTNSKN